LPAAIFGLVVGAPAAFVTIMGECFDEGCPDERLILLAVITVTATLCLFITWVTDRMVRTLEKHGGGGWWAAAGGFVLAAALAVTLYALVLALT